MSDGRPEQGHHRVAHELLHRAAVTLEFGPKTEVVGRNQRVHILRVEPLGSRGEPDQVGEDDAYSLSLLAGHLEVRGRPSRSSLVQRSGEGWILFQDLALQLLELWTGIDPQLLDQQIPGVPVQGERFSLPAAPVEGEHELPS